jgi:hypothetical protein
MANMRNSDPGVSVAVAIMTFRGRVAEFGALGGSQQP